MLLQVPTGENVPRQFFFYNAIEEFSEDLGIIPQKNDDLKKERTFYLPLIQKAHSKAKELVLKNKLKEHFDIHGHSHPVAKKQRFASREVRNDIPLWEKFLACTLERYNSNLFTPEVRYLLDAIHSEMNLNNPNFTQRLLMTIPHFSPKKILESFAVDFQDDVLFSFAAKTFSTKQKDAFYTEFVNHFVEVIENNSI